MARSGGGGVMRAPRGERRGAEGVPDALAIGLRSQLDAREGVPNMRGRGRSQHAWAMDADYLLYLLTIPTYCTYLLSLLTIPTYYTYLL